MSPLLPLAADIAKTCAGAGCALTGVIGQTLKERCFGNREALASPGSHCSRQGKRRRSSSTVKALRSAENSEADTQHVLFTTDDVENHYCLLEELGSGQFATVFKARHQITGNLVAVKMMSKQLLSQEIDVMLRLNHINCVKLYEVFETDDEYQLVMELVEGCDMFDAVKTCNFEEEHAKRLMRQICEGVIHLHDQGIIHRDLKPENILLSDDCESIKIADFGLSRLLPEGISSMSSASGCGTPGYVAPEVLNQESYGLKIETWACGVMFYIMLAGYPPFPMDLGSRSVARVRNGQFRFPSKYWAGISELAKDLIAKMIVVNPEERLSLDEVLAHPWFAADAACEMASTAGPTSRAPAPATHPPKLSTPESDYLLELTRCTTTDSDYLPEDDMSSDYFMDAVSHEDLRRTTTAERMEACADDFSTTCVIS